MCTLSNQYVVGLFPVFERNKSMGNTLMYIPNNDTHN